MARLNGRLAAFLLLAFCGIRLFTPVKTSLTQKTNLVRWFAPILDT